MKSICFSIHHLILLIFGLTGCQPDKLPDNSILPDQLRITNSNMSLSQLNKVKSIDIKSSVSVDLGRSKNQDNYSQVKSNCWNDYLDNYSNITIVDNRKPLAIKDILPVQVFTPFPNSQPKLLCDFEISLIKDYEQKMNDSTFLLKEIEITNIENFNNFELPLEKEKKPGKILYFQKKDIQNTNFTMPIDNGQVFTLCEKIGKIYPFEKQVLKMGVFFDKKLFEVNNLSLCRLVIHQEIPAINWITRAFFIQDQEPKITYQYRPKYTANRENRWDSQKMGILTLFNESSREVYLQISELSTTISVMAVYSNFSQKNTNYKSNQLDFNVFWIVDNGILIKKGDGMSPNIYKLETGQSIDLSLETHDGFFCNYGESLTTIIQKNLPSSMGTDSGFRSKFSGDIRQNSFETPIEIKIHDCKTLFYLSGLLYHLHGFPKITFNSFETMDYQKWQPLLLRKLLKLQYNEKFSQWVPNYQVSNHCPGLEIKNKLKNYPTQNHGLSNLFKCRMDNH